MDFNSIFNAFYSMYRADSDVPTSGDDEYTVGLALANEAVNRWSNYDGMYWRELFDTNQSDGTGAQTIATGDTTYTAPTNFKEAGGYVKVVNSSGNTVASYPIVEVNQVQFLDPKSTFCYFKGNPKAGYVLNLNPAPESALNGLNIDYTYYKTPSLFTTGTDKTEMADPYFIVHRMLSSQFRTARNPYYASAKADAENALKQMKMDNDSGGFANPPTITDNSGSVFGQASGNGWWR